MADRPRAIPRSPRRAPVNEQAVRALEQRLEAEEAGGVVAPQNVSLPPAPPAPPLQAAVPVQPSPPVADHKLASLQARQGTMSRPYIRRDGRSTRATTIHFPVELHQKLKLLAAAQTDHRATISEIVTEAVQHWLAQRGEG